MLKKIKKFPQFVLAFFAVITIRLIRPWILVRFQALGSTRIGHFAGNVEMYLCERDAKINEIQDATPIQTSLLFVSKLVAMIFSIALILSCTILIGIIGEI